MGILHHPEKNYMQKIIITIFYSLTIRDEPNNDYNLYFTLQASRPLIPPAHIKLFLSKIKYGPKAEDRNRF